MNESSLPGHPEVATSEESVQKLDVSTSPVTVESEVDTSEGRGNIPPVFTESSKGLWEKLTTGGKEIAGWVSEKIKTIPLVERLVGKAKILYHSFWMNKHNEKAETLKNKIAEVEENIAQIAASEKQISNSLEKLKSLNTSGMDSVEEKLRHIRMNKDNLISSRDSYKDKLENRNQKMKLSLEKRDAVVDNFISRSKDKLEKINQGLESLKEKKDEFETKVAFEELVNKGKIEDLNTKLAMKEQIVEAFKSMGMSDSEIKDDPSLVELEMSIEKGFAEIKKYNEKTEKVRAKMQSKIEKISGKYQASNEKLNGFVKIKQNRKEEVVVEEVDSSPVESVEKIEPKMAIKDFVEHFNNFILDKFGDNLQQEPEIIDIARFAKMTKGIKELQIDSIVKFDQFKDIAKKYLEVSGISSERLPQLLDSFYEEKIK